MTESNTLTSDERVAGSAEEALRQSETRLRLALAGAQAGVWEWNVATGQVVWIGVETIHGLAPGAFGGTFEAYLRDVHPEDRERVQQTIARSVQNREPLDMEYRIVRPDGSVAWVEGKGHPQLDEEGRVTKMMGVCMDITARKTVEQHRDELLAREQMARADAEAADRLKDEFLAMLSHELRNPLNVVLGWTQLLVNGTLEPERASHAVEIVHRNSQAQRRIVEDLLDVSRFITGKLRLNVQPASLVTLINDAIDSIRVAAEAKEVQVISRLDLDTPPINADVDRLRQVLWNLLSNAIKFTPRGERIWVTLEPAGVNVVIRVRDSGKGIAPDLLPHIFERFRQGDASPTRAQGGLGLGLAIARHLIEAHGGTITAESPGENQGATFTVMLPALMGSGSGVPASAGA